MGIGATETFPKIKLPIATGFQSSKFRQTTSAYRRFIKHSSKSILAITPIIKKPRLLAHAGVVTVVAVTLVLGGHAGSARSQALVLTVAKPSAIGALDQTASAEVAAKVAAKADLLVSADATRQATTLSSQVALPTSDDGTLAKRQVVATAGDVTRGVTTYGVGNGDTLSAIAAKFGVTTDTIRWANSIDDADSLKPGQTLTILPVSGLLYAVQAGDTVDTLASKYQANAAQILSYNNAEVKGLVAGQKIIIPDGVKAEPIKAQAPAVQRTLEAVATVAAPTRLSSYSGGGNSYAYGYCTYYAASRRPDVGSFWGNAASWGYAARSAGFLVNRSPAPGAVAWTTAGYYGHVAIVEQVNGSSVLVSEMNFYGPGGGWNRVSSRWTSVGEWSGFIH